MEINAVAKPLFDPQQLPIDSIAGEAAVAPERLTADWLRHRFVEPPSWEMECVDEFGVVQQRPERIRAAVLVALIQREGGLTLLGH